MKNSWQTFQWPANQKMAINLSYDDALNSQLDNALPSLNRYGFKGSFYLPTSYPPVDERMADWRLAAAQGHELGNHSVHHCCSASLPEREWVSPEQDLDQYSLLQIKAEVIAANGVLESIDGKTERTFAPPCNDIVVEGENYLPLIEKYFVGVRGYMNVPAGFDAYLVPEGACNELSLIEQVKNEANKGTKLLNIIFHGIGGDYLSVPGDEHDSLLEYLNKNRQQYWVDSCINTMKFVNQNI